MLTVAGEINSDQRSPQANLGSVLTREGRLGEQGQETTHPEKPDSLARLLENKGPHGAERRCLGLVYPG